MKTNSLLLILGVLLVAAGAFGLAKGEFSYTREAHQANIVGLEFSLKERETIAIPHWASSAAIALGVALLVFGRRK